MRVHRIHVKEKMSVKQYAYAQDRNGGCRPSMEDCTNIQYEDYIIRCKEDGALFGILDGHGGSEVAEYCAEAIPKIFMEQKLNVKDNNYQQVFEKVSMRVDKSMSHHLANSTGSTFCLAYIHQVNSRRFCHVANLGDTRAVLCLQNRITRRISIDHKVSNPSQCDRIRGVGGTIIKGRVGGSLAITRALGDHQLKQYGVSNIPDYEQFQITDKCNFMIIASDGLWDVCQDQKAVEICVQLPTTAAMASKLIQYALSHETRDNISAIVIKF